MGAITVKGRGYVSAQPALSFDIGTKARDYAECVDRLTGRTAALRQNLAAASADCAELKTTNFSVNVAYRYDKSRYHFDGYSASHRMEIELPVDKDMLNRVLGAVAKGHSGAEIRIHFSVKDTEDLRQQALAEAVRVAKLSADSLAQAAGVKLGRIRSIAHGWDEIRLSGPSYGVVCDSVSDAKVDIDPKDVSISEDVTVVYEIEEQMIMPVHVGVDKIGEAPEHFASGMWVFDAKFGFDRQSESDLSAKADYIHKMHAYRDSLIGCRGAYAVYPGDAAIMYSAPTPDRPTHINRSIAGRDGIGSVANRVPMAWAPSL